MALVAWACFLGPAPAQAAPVAGEILPLLQPDGTRVEVRIWGDEYYQVVESLDGHTLVRDPQTRMICYARRSADGHDLVSTGVKLGRDVPGGLAKHARIHADSARRKIDAARAALPPAKRAHRGPQSRPAASAGTTGASLQTETAVNAMAEPSGAVQGICLIIDFSDDVATITPASVASYCNQIGYTGYGNNGSVRDYFDAVSNGQVIYTNFVPSAYYRAAHPKTYYTDSSISYGTRARELIIEALTALNAGGFDFSQYDADDDGAVDALNCLYAGYSNSAWSTGLWPHASSVYYSADGVHTDNYQVTDMQTSLRLSTFCHENGHMLCGWPDLYDYGYESKGVGQHCIMGYSASSTNPQEPCAYMKYISGWSTTTVLTTPQAGISVPASSTNVSYKFNKPSAANEYFLIENRQKTGRDAALPDSGLAVWHIDTYGSNNNEQMTPSSHYRVTLVQADGRWDLEHNSNYGDGTDLWGDHGYTRLDPYTSPNTNWWSGSTSFLGISDISASGATMTFTFVSVGDCNQNNTADDLDISSGTSLDCNSNGIPDECETDSDHDGLIDDCDPDIDGDGALNAADNCPTVSNAGQEDADVDDVGNACDVCPNTVQGASVGDDGCPASIKGDLDRDGDVDQEDFGRFQVCYSATGVPASPAWCANADLDDNNSVTGTDFAVFFGCVSGADTLASLSCAN